jgi:hypothetical protein
MSLREDSRRIAMPGLVERQILQGLRP